MKYLYKHKSSQLVLACVYVCVYICVFWRKECCFHSWLWGSWKLDAYVPHSTERYIPLALEINNVAPTPHCVLCNVGTYEWTDQCTHHTPIAVRLARYCERTNHWWWWYACCWLHLAVGDILIWNRVCCFTSFANIHFCIYATSLCDRSIYLWKNIKLVFYGRVYSTYHWVC